jgi:hypothetical protein
MVFEMLATDRGLPRNFSPGQSSPATQPIQDSAVAAWRGAEPPGACRKGYVPRTEPDIPL